jgi:hypothetical protein
MIDPALIKHLDNESQARLRAFEQMFDSDGWKLTYEFLEYQYKLQKQNVLLATSWEDNRVAFGRMTVLGDILKLKESTSAEFESMALDAKETVAEEALEGEIEYE